MSPEKPNQKNLEKRVKELAEQLEQERQEKKDLEVRLMAQESGFSFKKVLQFFSPKPIGKGAPASRPMPFMRNPLRESIPDDLSTYQNKLKKYDLSQLEDIFLHLDREAFPERFKAVVQELKTRQ